MSSYWTVVHSDLLLASLERAIGVVLVGLQNTIARLPDLEVHCVSMSVQGLSIGAAWARYGLVTGALVNKLSDCRCYCRFDVDCGCFLMVYAFKCSIWFSR